MTQTPDAQASNPISPIAPSRHAIEQATRQMMARASATNSHAKIHGPAPTHTPCVVQKELYPASHRQHAPFTRRLPVPLQHFFRGASCIAIIKRRLNVQPPPHLRARLHIFSASDIMLGESDLLWGTASSSRRRMERRNFRRRAQDDRHSSCAACAHANGPACTTWMFKRRSMLELV
ncbi:hypothetical protein A0H81_08807 [Grifola frondosa]|uniref:Uncharacterized protein n=1 Tax=Grifola frondosa TaxID=5627 RepID=A0A1C7M2D2_GRIFR|nr:hypothetical protein A0H81_08807 [Grifola frondosa]